MSGPVAWGVAPIEGEALMSLVTRTSARNILPSSHVLLRQVGSVHANNPTVAMMVDLDVDHLARILRVPAAEVDQRRYRPLRDAGFVDSSGAAVRANEIAFRRRRFSPTAIGASPHQRALWALKSVPCCTETWEYLVDTCRCGTKQRWCSAYSLYRCDRCNFLLSKVEAAAVDPQLRDGLGFLIGLLDPIQENRVAARRQLPPALATWNGGMVFELALALLPLTSDPYRFARRYEPAAKDRKRYARSLAQAADLIRTWPDSFLPSLEKTVMSRPTWKRHAPYKGIADYIPGLLDKSLASSVQTAIEGALAPITCRAEETPPDQITIMDAQQMTGWGADVLAKARRDGQLRTRICVRANRVLSTLDLAEAKFVDDFSANRVSAEAASRSMGLPQYAMSMFADAGHIKFASHPFLIERYGHCQLHRADLQNFLGTLQDARVEAQQIAKPIPLHRIARAMGGGFKPWGTMIDILIARDVPFSMSGDSVDDIYVDARDAARLRELGPTTTPPSRLAEHCSQRDACELLNLPFKHANLLVQHVPLDETWKMRWADILSLACARITLSEMSARLDMNPTKLTAQLERLSLPRFDLLGWKRDEALRFLLNI